MTDRDLSNKSEFAGWFQDGELVGPSGRGGGKGGKSGSSGGFTEDPNTAQSDATFTAVDLLGEGPIVGPWYGLQSIFLNNVPLYNVGGGRNFIGIAVDWRAGLPDQTHFVGMDVVEQPIVVNARFTNGVGDSDAQAGGPPYAPFVFEAGMAISEGVVNPDFVGLTIQVNGLTVMDTKAGELKGNSVQISLWCAGSDMNDFAQIGQDIISAKVTAPYQRSYAFRPVGQPPWTFQVRRDTIDFTKSTEVGDTYVFSYSLIYDQKLTYMNSACVAMLIDASEFGQNLPTRSYDMLGLIISVPSNYNPYARTYDGIWDGTFVEKWCNNPAWVCYDLLVRKRYGLGKRIPPEMVDKWALYAIAQYCDERVPDMKGGSECRFSFEGVIAGQQDAYTIVNQVASCFRGLPYWGASGITFTQDAPTAIGNVPDGTIVALYISNSIVNQDAVGATRINTGDVLYNDDSVTSPDGTIALQFQEDGNLVLIHNGTTILWASGTDGSGADRVLMQVDGNLVIYAGSTVVWETNTSGHTGGYGQVQNDGNFVIYGPNLVYTPYSVPVAIFTPANVIDGDFSYEGTAEKARHSIALVAYNDPRNDFKQEIEPVEIPELIERYGMRPIRVVAYGCCRRSQAHRLGKWILSSEQFETETVTFTTGLDYADITPGSIIGISDPHRSAEAMGGRIITGDLATIRIDRTFNFDFLGQSYDIMFQNPSGEGILRRHIISAAPQTNGQTILSTAPNNQFNPTDINIDDVPTSGSVYVITNVDLEDETTTHGRMRLFRVISNKEQKSYQYQITGVEHAPNKFITIDDDEPLVISGGVPYSNWPVGAPRGLNAVVNVYVVGDNPRIDITLSWQAPKSPNPADPDNANDPRVTNYDVWTRINNVWSLVASTASPSFTITNLAPGDYFYGVRARTPVSVGPFAQVEVNEVALTFGTPADVGNFTAHIGFNDFTLFWDESPSTGVDKYEVTRDGAHFLQNNGVANTNYYRVFDDIWFHTYGIRAGNSVGDYSEHEAQFTFRPLEPPDPIGFSIYSLDTDSVTLEWDAAPPLGTSYEVRYGVDWLGSTFLQGGIIANRVTISVADPSSLNFWCKTKSNVGLYSILAFSTEGILNASEDSFTNARTVATISKVMVKTMMAVVGVETTIERRSIYSRDFLTEVAVNVFAARRYLVAAIAEVSAAALASSTLASRFFVAVVGSVQNLLKTQATTLRGDVAVTSTVDTSLVLEPENGIVGGAIGDDAI